MHPADEEDAPRGHLAVVVPARRLRAVRLGRGRQHAARGAGGNVDLDDIPVKARQQDVWVARRDNGAHGLAQRDGPGGAGGRLVNVDALAVDVLHGGSS